MLPRYVRPATEVNLSETIGVSRHHRPAWAEGEMMDSREVSVVLPEDEWHAMTSELGVDSRALSPAACAAIMTAEESPPSIARHFNCSVADARELLRWCEEAAERWNADDPEGAAVLERAARNLRYALWTVGEGPPPDPIHYRPS